MDENITLSTTFLDADFYSYQKDCRFLPGVVSLVLSVLLALTPLSRLEAIPSAEKELSVVELLEDSDGDGKLDHLGERVTVSGRALVGRGVFSDRYLISYLQDRTAGIMIFSDTLDVPVEKGDSLLVTGTLKQYVSKPEIVVEHLKVVDTDQRVPKAVPLNEVFEDPERYRGHLVSGEATVRNYDENIKMLHIGPTDGSDDSLHVFVSRSNVHYDEFLFDALDAGEHVYIKGILIRYTSAYNGKTFYQVLPRRREDFIVSDLRPTFKEDSFIYADIDKTSGIVYVLLDSGLWSYDLQKESWLFLDTLEDFEGALSNYEFGFNPQAGRIQLWSEGIGEFYTVNPETYNVKRKDRAVYHQNQYGHYPFFRDSTVYAFGGYGYWDYHNIMVYYNRSRNQWSKQSVDMHSPVPGRRIPRSGVYDQGNDRLYIFGGRGTKSGNTKDVAEARGKLRDIWKFSFNNQKWEEITVLDQPEKGGGALLPSKIVRTNKQSSSFYLPEEEIWFIPAYNQGPGETFYLRPVHLPSQKQKGNVLPDFGPFQDFTPTNYLYYPHAKEVVFVGIDNWANAESYPVRIVRLPADSLMASVSTPGYFSLYKYLAGLLVVGGLLFLFYRNRSNNEMMKKENDFSSFRSLVQVNWLKNEEKKLLEYLYEEQQFRDSHDIEELLWSDVGSYDYRRRLRNDIIKSINKKVKNRHHGEENLILRKKDPDDNRRYLYGLNENLLEE